jgi:flagellar hook protein FlgE
MDAFGIALSGLQAASAGLQVGSNNIANALSDGFKAKRVERSELVSNGQGAGVQIGQLTEDPSPTVPGGSNVDLATEFVNSSVDSLLYTANLKVIKSQDQLFQSTLDLKA